jgi:tetratricopeptide (TPR) repeat protein
MRPLLALAVALAAGCDLSAALTQRTDPAVDRDLKALEARAKASPEDLSAQVALGNAYLGAQRFFLAADTFKAVQQKAPDDPRVRVGLAECYNALGYLIESWEQLKSCTDHNPNDPECVLRMAVLMKGDGSKSGLTEARRLFERFLKVAPSDPRAAMARSNLEQVEAQLKQAGMVPPPEAEPAEEAPHAEGVPEASPPSSAEAMVPGHPSAGSDEGVGELNPFGVAIQKALAAMRRNDPAGAEAAFKEALAIRPDDPAAVAGLAEAQLALGKNSEAQASADKAIALDPKDEQARWAYGLVMIRTTKNVPKAIETWRSLVADDPEYAKKLGVTKMLEQIDQIIAQHPGAKEKLKAASPPTGPGPAPKK